MYHRPFLDQVQSPSWQVPFEDIQCSNVHGGLKFAVTGVKVWRRVIIEKHTDQDSVECADGRHSARPDSTIEQISPHRSPVLQSVHCVCDSGVTNGSARVLQDPLSAGITAFPDSASADRDNSEQGMVGPDQEPNISRSEGSRLFQRSIPRRLAQGYDSERRRFRLYFVAELSRDPDIAPDGSRRLRALTIWSPMNQVAAALATLSASSVSANGDETSCCHRILEARPSKSGNRDESCTPRRNNS